MLNVKLSDKLNKSVLSLALATVYRPPGPYTDFLKEFADFLSDPLVNVDKALIVGDFNIHVDNTNDALGLAFTDLINSFGVKQNVTGPTHRFNHTLDLIISHGIDLTDIDIIPQSDDVTDHFLVSCMLHITDINYMAPRYRPGRIIIAATKNSTQNLLDYNLQLDGCNVTSSTVKNLGVILDSKLSFENHISNVTKTAFFHLRNISKLRNMLSVSDAEKLVHAFMTSRLDYCNALLGGCPASSINKLQVVQNAAARVLTRSRKYDHITPILQSLHWLPIKFRISYKILLLAYKALNDLAPVYLTNLLSRYNPTRSLRSQNSGLLVVPRIAKSTKGGRTFSYLAPKLWNSLPDNVRGSDTLSLFKSRLKTHLFSQAFI